MRRLPGLLLTLVCFVATAAGQDVPLEIKGETVTVVKALPFTVNAPEGYHIYNWSFPAGVTAIDKGSILQVTAAPKGQLLVSVKLTKILWKEEKIETRYGTITFAVGDVPAPQPKPDDPQPKPDVDPSVKPPIPLPGFRVMILYEKADLTKYPTSQQIIPQSKTIRDYLNERCALEPDGKTKAYYIGDKDVDFSRYFPGWKEALSRPRASLPWIIVSNGKTGFEGPLPLTVPETLNLLKKYGD